MRCYFCFELIEEKDRKSSWKEVKGWVGGTKQHGMKLRVDTGRRAHEDCINKINQGQSVTQPELFDTQQLTLKYATSDVDEFLD